MKKSVWQNDQQAQMDKYDIRMSARHARRARKRGNGNIAEGVRIVLEEDEERQLSPTKDDKDE